MAITIRAAGHDDVPQVLRGYEWLFAPPGGRPAQWDEGRAADALHEAVDDARAEVLVAADEAAVVGLCTIYLDLRSVRYGQRAWVEDLAVDAGHRSAGVGKRLLDAARAWAAARGATHLELDSGTARADAHRFYERERPTWRSLCFGWELEEASPGA